MKTLNNAEMTREFNELATELGIKTTKRLRNSPKKGSVEAQLTAMQLKYRTEYNSNKVTSQCEEINAAAIKKEEDKKASAEKYAKEQETKLVTPVNPVKKVVQVEKGQSTLAALKESDPVVKAEPKKDALNELMETMQLGDITAKRNKTHVKLHYGKNTIYVYSSKGNFKLALENNTRARLSDKLAAELGIEYTSSVWADCFFKVSEKDIETVLIIMGMYPDAK